MIESPSLNSWWAAVIGAGVGGVGSKLLDKWLVTADRSSEGAQELQRIALSEAQQLRTELRSCRETNFQLQQEYNSLQLQYNTLLVAKDNLEHDFKEINHLVGGLKMEIKIIRGVLQRLKLSSPELDEFDRNKNLGG